MHTHTPAQSLLIYARYRMIRFASHNGARAFSIPLSLVLLFREGASVFDARKCISMSANELFWPSALFVP